MTQDFIRRDDAPEPCPFCGKSAVCYWGSDVFTDEDQYQIICDSCGVQGKNHTTRELAIAAWNIRALPAIDPDAIREERKIAALQTALDVLDRDGITQTLHQIPIIIGETK